MVHSDAEIVAALLAYREHLLKDGDDFWPFVREGTKRGANKFFLACIIDLQQPARRAWEQARRFAEETMSDCIQQFVRCRDHIRLGSPTRTRIPADGQLAADSG